MKNHANKMSVLAPLTGQIITLEQVPDPVFSGKMLGDGIAIVPEEGKIYSPVSMRLTFPGRGFRPIRFLSLHKARNSSGL